MPSIHTSLVGEEDPPRDGRAEVLLAQLLKRLQQPDETAPGEDEGEDRGLAGIVPSGSFGRCTLHVRGEEGGKPVYGWDSKGYLQNQLY